MYIFQHICSLPKFIIFLDSTNDQLQRFVKRNIFEGYDWDLTYSDHAIPLEIAKLSLQLPLDEKLYLHLLFVVVVPHPWHLLSSPLYDVSDHTNHIFSVRIWSWQHVSVIHCWVEPSLLLSSCGNILFAKTMVANTEIETHNLNRQTDRQTTTNYQYFSLLSLFSLSCFCFSLFVELPPFPYYHIFMWPLCNCRCLVGGDCCHWRGIGFPVATLF